MWHSDQQLADYLLTDLDAADGSPLFSFAVSYQNHGPYAETESTVPYVSPEASGCLLYTSLPEKTLTTV